ncbi:hypothetical protein VPH35_114646 [Triticum aestivum]|uniref:putative disease resistance protein RGA4 n=1 Tax=Triticum aestivum TaxID=4565 RepID=UPI001D02EB56|nr:putative disease resistance protein RGA4 [Triticum aestivum]
MNLPKTVGVISAINECANLFQWAKSAISSMCSRWSGSHQKVLQDDVLYLQSGLQRLSDTLPAMYNLIDAAEWRSHEYCVSELLPKLKDAMYDAEELLDELRWYEMKVELEANARKYPFNDFFDVVIQGSFNKLNAVQARIDHLSSQMEKMGLRQATQHFDRLVRPETSSLPNEAKLYGRDKELDQVMGLLRVPINSKRKRARSSGSASTSTSPRNQISKESRIPSLPVLPIVGIGGVGKTTIAQHICNNKRVKSHFDKIIWICVSDDFDVKRLTKEAIQSCSGKEVRIDNLDSLHHALREHVKNKRFLIVLDDMWDDALKENGQCWNKFCAPLESFQEGSMMLVTTRCRKVAEGVSTMEPIVLQGLKDDVFWDFFKVCAFGSDSSNNDTELERIGKSILGKLKGSPLAAKTLGRMLRMNLQASHWNTILKSELWELKQEPTDILPALRLSYMYLPFYLKRCFSFCAVYPKDYKFIKADLAEIWVAEGFVESQGDDPIQNIGCQYFEDLIIRSFFQKVSGGYVIHDLLHDMAQKVSEHDCFTIRYKNDFDKVPKNVRHIYVQPSSDFDNSNLLSLCRHTKLRTIICKKQSGNKTSTVMHHWCTELLRIRVISCASTNELPNNIGNLKHLRYLKISKGRPLSIPSTFCWLYNLQILDVKTCKIESLPQDFGNLSNLQRFESQGFLYHLGCSIDVADKKAQGIRLIKNLNQFRGDMVISNAQMLSKDHATEAALKNKKYLNKLTLEWSGASRSQIMQENAIEVLRVMQPLTSTRSLSLKYYPGLSLPSWFHPQNINSNEIPAVHKNIDDSIGISRSLTELDFLCCQGLSSLDHFLHPDYVPAIKKISIMFCTRLTSLPTERFHNFCHLEKLSVNECPIMNWQRGLVLPSSLQTLTLQECGDYSACIPGCIENLKSLVSLRLSGCMGVTSIPGSIWLSNPLLEEWRHSCRTARDIMRGFIGRNHREAVGSFGFGILPDASQPDTQ